MHREMHTKTAKRRPINVAIDLRSDTLSLPSGAMRKAMLSARLGDDQYGEDPTVNALEERVAGLLGKEAALFVASGTMANQVALRVLTRPGDVVLVGAGAHVLMDEQGAAALAGLQLQAIGNNGLFSADDVRSAHVAPGHMLCAPTSLVAVENPHNTGGGIPFPVDITEDICQAAKDLKMATYLDGARLFNAAACLNQPVDTLADPFDMVAIALSKGLGCPVGSLLAGTNRDIASARRIRKMLGGAMRQAGVLAAAGLYALDHNVEKIPIDHSNARILAKEIASAPNVCLDIDQVVTNLVFFNTLGNLTANKVVECARSEGILVSAFGPNTVRAATYLNVSESQCRTAGRILRRILVELSD